MTNKIMPGLSSSPLRWECCRRVKYCFRFLRILMETSTILRGFVGSTGAKGIHNKGSLVKRIIGVSYTSGMSVLVAEVELVILVPIPVERPDNNIMEHL